MINSSKIFNIIVLSNNDQNGLLNQSQLTLELKDALINSLNSNSHHFYKPNPQKIYYQKLDFTILSTVFLELRKSYSKNNILDVNLLNYGKTRLNQFDLNDIKKQLIQNFHSTANLCIEHYVLYHENSFSRNEFYKKKYYQTKNKEETRYDLYKMAFNNLVIGPIDISYSIETLNINAYDYINTHFIFNVNNSKKHKRYTHIRAKKELNRISKAETGIAYRDYYPFYKKTKIDLEKYTSNTTYAFLLETKDINKLLNAIILFSPNKNDISVIQKDMKLFLSNELDRINFLFFEKRTKILIYLIYKLHKIGKCSPKILFEQLKALNKLKYLPQKYFNNYSKQFDQNENNFPLNHKFIDDAIKLIEKK